MARQEINIGTAPTGAGGDTTRSGAVKINAMTQDLYGRTDNLKSAAYAQMVGTVSVSGGVANGAIIERGSNANGDYTKFADGTMICRKRVLAPVFAAAAYLQVEWQFPAVFIEPPVILSSGVAGIDQIRYNRGVPSANQSTSSTTLRVFATGSDVFQSTDSSTLQGLAIGRWYA